LIVNTKQTKGSRVLWGHRILHKLGTGPLGSIYAAVDLSTGDRVALRGFRRPHGADEALWDAAIARFADAMANHCIVDDHPSIQTIVRFGQDGQTFFIATEYFEHPTLRSVLDTNGPMEIEAALEILPDIASALDYAAANGCIHTDLTPRNILVTAGTPAAVVTNFGLAQARDKGDSVYLSPEQILTGKASDRAHIFSAGAILYEMISGSPAFAGETPTQRRRSVVANKPAPLSNYQPYIWQVIRCMMASEPFDRYATVAEAVEDLRHHRRPHSIIVARGRSYEAEVDGDLALLVQSELAGLDEPDAVIEEMPNLELPAIEPELSAFRVNRQFVMECSLYAAVAREMAAKTLLTSSGRIAVASALVLAGLLGVHLSRGRAAFETATITAAQGRPRLVLNGTPIPIAPGETVSSKGFQMLTTDGQSSVVVSMRGCRVKVLPNSKVILRKIGYDQGASRQFQLVQGAVLETIDPTHRKTASFETLAGPVAVHASGGRLLASIDSDGQTQVANLGGNLAVDNQGTTFGVPSGQALTLNGRDRDSAVMADLEPAARAMFNSQKDLLAPPGIAERVDRAVGAAEDQVLLRASDDFEALRSDHTESALKDAQALQAAQTAVQAIAILLETSENGEIPRDLDLDTLQPISAGTDMHAALASLDGHHLLSYTQIDKGRYEFTARACDTTHTLLRVHDGTVELVQEGAAKKQPLLNFIKRFIDGTLIPSKRS